MTRTLAIMPCGVVLACCAAAAADGQRPCPPDVDCSGAVDVGDLVAVVTAWGLGGTPEDVDGSGTVDVGDLVEVIVAWGPCLFQFLPQPDQEAEQIALEMLGPAGPLLFALEEYERIDRDLDLIRAAVPALQGETHTPAWAPADLIVQVSQSLPKTGYDCVNTYSQVVLEDLLFSSGGFDWYVITLAGSINVEALAGVYMRLAEVGVAEPNGLIGGQNTWAATDLGGGVWRWDIDDGWHDCFDGCDCHRVYVIETDAEGNVEVIDVSEFGLPWCEF
jgi:hypothetical protein